MASPYAYSASEYAQDSPNRSIVKPDVEQAADASSQPHQLAAVDETPWEEHVSVSLRGAYYCAQAAFEPLGARGGTLVMMTSTAGMQGIATLPLYSMMKGALRGFAKGLAREGGPAGVTVNVVSPIAYSPAMTAAIEADPLMGKGFSRQIPLGRVGDPENEVGAGVAMLSGPHARYVTGQTLGIDGGQFTSQ
jgi:NAD(P)-dependent dehydrogenase (short-subunit alcohol dehydrogenase family)